MQNKKQMFLSVIICTYNRADILIKCLQALEEQTLSKDLFEVIISDDGSTDETKNKVAAFQNNGHLLSINYIYQNHDGPASARNKAIKITNADILVFLNDDIILDKFCLEQHYKFHQNNPFEHIGVTGIVQWHKDMEITPFRKYITSKERVYQFNYELLLKNYPKCDETNPVNFWTANVSVKRNFLLKYGMFDDKTFKHAMVEDIELGHRLGKSGFKLKLLPSAIGYHYHNIEMESYLKRHYLVGKYFAILIKKYPEIESALPLPTKTSFKTYNSQIFQLVYKLLEKIKIVEASFPANSSLDSPLPNSSLDSHRSTSPLDKGGLRGVDYITLKLLYRELLDLCFTLGYKEEIEKEIKEDIEFLKFQSQWLNPSVPSKSSDFICPKCKNPIIIQNKILTCKKNCTTYYVKNEIPDFASDYSYKQEINRQELSKLLNEAENGDYKKVLYKWCMNQNNLAFYNYLTNYSKDAFKFLLPITSDSVVLELNCEWGVLSVPLANISKKVVAVDTMMEKLKFCKIRNKQENINNITLIRATPAELPFLDNRFDFVIMHGMFNEIGNIYTDKKPIDWQKQALKEAYRVLKKNGYLFLSTENCYGFKYVIGAPDDYTKMSNIIFLPKEKAEEVYKFYSKKEYRAYIYSHDEYINFLKENKFKNIKTYYTSPNYGNAEVITPLDNLTGLDYYLKNIQNNFPPNTMQQAVRNLETGAVESGTIGQHCNYYLFIGQK